ncbi:unnamed protein product [Calypogeia fissa]
MNFPYLVFLFTLLGASWQTTYATPPRGPSPTKHCYDGDKPTFTTKDWPDYVEKLGKLGGTNVFGNGEASLTFTQKDQTETLHAFQTVVVLVKSLISDPSILEPKELLENADKVVADCCKERNGQPKPECHGGFSNIIKAGVAALQVQVVAVVSTVRCSPQRNYVSVTGLKDFYTGLYATTHAFHKTWSLEDGNGRPITEPLILFGENSGPLGPEIQLKRRSGQKGIVHVMLVGPPLYFLLKQCCPRYLGVQLGGCRGGQIAVKLDQSASFQVILKFHPEDYEVKPGKKRNNEEEAPPNSGKKRRNEEEAPPNSGLRRSSRTTKT